MKGSDLWGGVKAILSKVAPIAANAVIPGSGGFVSGLLSNILGVENEPYAIEEALKRATPEQIIKIKEAELKHEERMLEIAAENDKMFLKDRQSARDRESRIVEATGGKDTNLYVLAWVNVIGFFAALILVIVIEMPTSEVAKTAVAMLLGALIATYKDVIGYFFGSSKSSTDKTKLMSNKS